MDPYVAVPLLMEVLTESHSRSTRMGVFKRLATYNLLLTEPFILKNLKDDRWYVRRNMLALLNEMGAYTEAITPATYAKHTDARVRREALQLWMRSPQDRERAVCLGLSDPDERTLRSAVAEAQRRCPDAAVSLIAKRLQEELPVDLRTQLVKLLVGQRSAVALEALMRIASSGRTLFGKPKLAPRSPESLAALNVLAQTWSFDARVAALLARARKSDDPDVRAAVSTTSADR
jgi:hypothetical protein